MDALETAFYYPLDIEFDDHGRALILDFNNLRLRRLNADNTIETIMGLDFADTPVKGLPAIETPLHRAGDMEFDHLGRMVLAGNHVALFYMVERDNTVHWIAGNGDFGNTGDEGPASSATSYAPFGVAPTSDGGLYISDNESHTVRYVDPQGVIHAIAGNGTRGFSGDGGPAFLAQLDSPTDLRFAQDGTLHIADRRNNVIRRIKSDGTIETVIGTGGRGFGGDSGMASECLLNRASAINFAPDGSLWIADTYNQRVRRVAGYAASTAPWFRQPIRTRSASDGPAQNFARADALVSTCGSSPIQFADLASPRVLDLNRIWGDNGMMNPNEMPPGEIARRGQEIYETRIRSEVEREHQGKYLVLDIESGDYEIDADHLAASDRAAAKHPDAPLYALRIGYRTLGRIGWRRPTSPS